MLQPFLPTPIAIRVALRALGGPGSGNFGHAGREGKRGGSAAQSFKDFSKRLDVAAENLHPGDSKALTGPQTISEEDFKKYFRSKPGSPYKEGTGPYKGWGEIGKVYEKDGFTVVRGKMTVTGPEKSVALKESWSKRADLRDAVSTYTQEDARPTGALGQKLEQVIRLSAPLPHDVVSYRGMRVDDATLKSLKPGSVLRLGRPSSFTNQQAAAWDFAKAKGHRASSGKNGVLLEALVPKGTRAGYVGWMLNIGDEHLLSGKTKYVVHGVKPYRGGTKVQVEIVR